jgi:hypothetical protein
MAEIFRLPFGVDYGHSCALLLAVTASLGPFYGLLVGDPGTLKYRTYHSAVSGVWKVGFPNAGYQRVYDAGSRTCLV